jgi:hypothetical protein
MYSTTQIYDQEKSMIGSKETYDAMNVAADSWAMRLIRRSRALMLLAAISLSPAFAQTGCVPDMGDDGMSTPSEEVLSSDVNQELNDGSIGILSSSACTVGSSGTCTTAFVPSNRQFSFIDVVINNRLRPSPCSYWVRDTVNQEIVHEGSVDAGGTLNHRLNRVFSTYVLHLHHCSLSARGGLDNE